MANKEKNRSLLLATLFVMNIAMMLWPMRILTFRRLWTDPTMTIHPGSFPGEELINRVWSMTQICVILPLGLIAVSGLIARKLWGALLAMVVLGISLAHFLAYLFTSITLQRAEIASDDYSGVFVIIAPVFFSAWTGLIGFLLWRNRELLE